MWKSEFDDNLQVISSASTSQGCSNCNEKDLRIHRLEAQKQVLETRVRMLEARLEMATNPDNHDHACQSDAILHDLLGDMENFRIQCCCCFCYCCCCCCCCCLCYCCLIECCCCCEKLSISRGFFNSCRAPPNNHDHAWQSDEMATSPRCFVEKVLSNEVERCCVPMQITWLFFFFL